jgi:hypothetical protein
MSGPAIQPGQGLTKMSSYMVWKCLRPQPVSPYSMGLRPLTPLSSGCHHWMLSSPSIQQRKTTEGFNI